MASFRPSVLPDRDNDILSTFTRSFERARQSSLRDQANQRATAQHTASMAAHEQSMELSSLQAALSAETTEGVRVGQPSDILGAFRGARGPANVGMGSNQPMTPEAQAVSDAAVIPPSDERQIGTMGGEPVTFSPRRRRSERRQTAADEREDARLDTRSEMEAERDPQEMETAIGLVGVATGADGQPIFNEADIRSGLTDPATVIQWARDEMQSERSQGRQQAGIRLRSQLSPARQTTLDAEDIPAGASGAITRSYRDAAAAWVTRATQQDGYASLFPDYVPPEIPSGMQDQMWNDAIGSSYESGAITAAQRDTLLGRRQEDAAASVPNPLDPERVPDIAGAVAEALDDNAIGRAADLIEGVEDAPGQIAALKAHFTDAQIRWIMDQLGG